MDERLRRLERDGEREKLSQEYLRLGRGWQGQEIPQPSPNCVITAWRNRPGIYRLSTLRDCDIELVYVPGGEIECQNCGPGGFQSFDPAHCDQCPGTGPGAGKMRVAPFYVGRYPIVWKEYLAFCRAAKRNLPDQRHMNLPPGGAALIETILERDIPYVPATGVEFKDAEAFCAWSGSRLPSPDEWTWMSLGPKKIPCPHHAHVEGKKGCTSCDKDGTVTIKFPWSFNAWAVSGPADDLCVWSGHSHYRKPAPVIVREYRHAKACPDFGQRHDAWDNEVCMCFGHRWPDGPLVPARPFGASWCGAIDTSGNVAELCSDKLAYGGTFRTTFDAGLEPVHRGRSGRVGSVWDLDEVGFRVAVSGL